MARSRRGVFITLEGPDGSGKSTQMRLLAARLRGAGVPCVVTREPGGGNRTALAEKIRELVLSHRKPAPTAPTELFLFLAARAQHVHDLIRPALERGRSVLCERFADATYAYQVGGRRLPAQLVRDANSLAAGGLAPDLTILLDLPANAGLKLAFQAKAGHDRIESEAAGFHRRVRAAYLALARREPKRVRVVSAAQPAERVAARIWALVRPVLMKGTGHAVQ